MIYRLKVIAMNDIFNNKKRKLDEIQTGYDDNPHILNTWDNKRFIVPVKQILYSYYNHYQEEPASLRKRRRTRL